MYHLLRVLPKWTASYFVHSLDTDPKKYKETNGKGYLTVTYYLEQDYHARTGTTDIQLESSDSLKSPNKNTLTFSENR